MTGRRSAPVDLALKAYKPGANVYALARRFGVSASTLYRALRSCGYSFPKKHPQSESAPITAK